MQLMEDEQYKELDTKYPDLILPQTCTVAEFCGGGGLNRCPDWGLSLAGHSERQRRISFFQWKIENGKWEIVTENDNKISPSKWRGIGCGSSRNVILFVPHKNKRNQLSLLAGESWSEVEYSAKSSLPHPAFSHLLLLGEGACSKLDIVNQQAGFPRLRLENDRTNVTLNVAKSLNDNFKEILHFVQNDRLCVTLRSVTTKSLGKKLRRFFACPADGGNGAQNDSKSTFSPRWEKVAVSRMRGDIEQPNFISTLITPPAIVTHYVHTIASSPSREDKSVIPYSTTQLLNFSTAKQEVCHA